MTLSVSQIGENPQQPGIVAETFIPDQLIAGNLKLVTQQIRVASGSLPRGAVLGQKTATSFNAAAVAGNTGNGTIGAVSEGATPLYGVYSIKATSPTVFSVTDPEGNALANAAAGTAYTSSAINFTITAGGTAFAVGDGFTVEVVEATGDYVLCVKTASDGSQTPTAVLVTTTDATGGPQEAGAYVMGEFNANAITFDPSWTLPALQTAMRPYSLFLKSAVSAADPT